MEKGLCAGGWAEPRTMAYFSHSGLDDSRKFTLSIAQHYQQAEKALKSAEEHTSKLRSPKKVRSPPARPASPTHDQQMPTTELCCAVSASGQPENTAKRLGRGSPTRRTVVSKAGREGKESRFSGGGICMTFCQKIDAKTAACPGPVGRLSGAF